MRDRTIVSYLTIPSIILLAALGYSCATNKGDTVDSQTKAPAPKLAESTSPGVAKKVDAKKVAKPQVLPPPPKLTATAAPVDRAPPKHTKATKAESKALQEARVTRYVAAQVLNIRAKPSTDAEIVGKLTKGSLLPVEIKGEWAKIGENQFVLSKFLSTQAKSVALAK